MQKYNGFSCEIFLLLFIEYNEDATDGSGKINLLSQRLLRTERNRYDKVRTQELDYQH